MLTMKEETQRLIRAAYIPMLWVFTLWAIKGLEWLSGARFDFMGVYPRSIDGLAGIALAPLEHADLAHLFNNSVPLLILGTSLFYFYREIAVKIIILVWLTTGLCVWIGGRMAIHIGASGIIYGFASFLFFSGLIRKNVKLIAISLLTVFLYGGLIWGVFPIWPELSWESHLFGGLSGSIFAFIYADEGPQKEEPDWGEDENEDEDPYWKLNEDETETNKTSNSAE